MATSSYAWSISGGSLTSPATGVSVTFKPTGLSGSTLTLRCTETNQALTVGPTAQATSTIVAAPIEPLLLAPSQVAVGLSYGASVTNLVGASSYRWSIEGGEITSPATGPSITFRPTGAPGAQLKLTCIEKNRAGQEGPEGIATAQIADPPSTPALALPQYVTEGERYLATIQNRVATSTYTWSITGGALETATGSSVTFTPTGEVGTPVALTCFETSAAGLSGEQSVAMATIIAPFAPLSLKLDPYLTSGRAYVASVQRPVSTSTYAWSIEGGTLASSSGSSVAFTAGAPGTATLTCVETNMAEIPGTPVSVEGQIVAAPVKPLLTAPAHITAEHQGSASVQSPVAGSTYAWTLSGATPTSATGVTIQFTAGSSGGIAFTCVETNRAQNAGPVATAISSIAAPPSIPVLLAPKSVTAGRSYSATVQSPVPGSSYGWSIENGSLEQSAGSEIHFIAGATGSVLLSAVETNRAGTPGTAGKATSTIVPAPEEPTIAAPAYVAANGKGIPASVAEQPGCSYEWTISGGVIAGSRSESSISFTAGAPGSITLTCKVTNSVGDSSSTATKGIEIEQPPVAEITAPNMVFTGRAATASVPQQEGATYAWTIQNGTLETANGATARFTAAIQGKVVLRCTVTNRAGVARSGTKELTAFDSALPSILGESVTQVAAGSFHACALLESGGVKCWGANGMGQIGDGSRTNRNTPTLVNGLSNGVISIATGHTHTCAILESGSVKCWGTNTHGQIGDDSITQRLNPPP